MVEDQRKSSFRMVHVVFRSQSCCWHFGVDSSVRSGAVLRTETKQKYLVESSHAQQIAIRGNYANLVKFDPKASVVDSLLSTPFPFFTSLIFRTLSDTGTRKTEKNCEKLFFDSKLCVCLFMFDERRKTLKATRREKRKHESPTTLRILRI